MTECIHEPDGMDFVGSMLEVGMSSHGLGDTTLTTADPIFSMIDVECTKMPCATLALSSSGTASGRSPRSITA